MPDGLLPRLGVNIDHVATLRQQRQHVRYPQPAAAAALAELAGASQITVHLREDRRHIQDGDLTVLARSVNTRLNLEMAATAAMLEIARTVRPAVVTLVPERRAELTTEGGLDIVGQRKALLPFVAELAAIPTHTSLFIDPDPEQVQASADVGAEAVELHTGRYCDARTAQERNDELQRVATAAKKARALGLRCYAGHGLSYENVVAIAAIHEIEELNIGHAIVARAVLVGMQAAVAEMAALCRAARTENRGPIEH